MDYRPCDVSEIPVETVWDTPANYVGASAVTQYARLATQPNSRPAQEGALFMRKFNTNVDVGGLRPNAPAGDAENQYEPRTTSGLPTFSFFKLHLNGTA